MKLHYQNFLHGRFLLLRLQCRIPEVSAAQSVHFCESAGSAREWEGKEGNPRK